VAEAIVYCDVCNRMIMPSAFRDAIISPQKSVCPQCLSKLEPEDRERIKAKFGTAEMRALQETSPAARAASGSAEKRRRTPTRHMRAVSAEEEAVARPNAWGVPALAVGGGLLLSIIMGLIFMGGGGGSPASPPPKRAANTTAAPPSAPAATPAAAKLVEIRTILESGASAHAEARRKLVAFPDFFGGTPEAAEAKALLDEIDAAHAKRQEEEFGKVLAGAIASAVGGEFDKAEASIRSMEKRFGDETWFESRGKTAVAETLAEITRLRAEEKGRNARSEAQRAEARRREIAATLGRARAELAEGRFDEAKKLVADSSKWPADERSQADDLALEIQRKEVAAAAGLRARAYAPAMKLTRELVADGRWREALAECGKALEAKPADKDAAELLAEITRRIVFRRRLTLNLGPGVKMYFVYIKPGTFVMGGDGELEADAPKQGVEKPKHRVAITKGFYLGKYEVTQGQFETLMGSNPSTYKQPDGPVHMVTWDEAVEFCSKAGEKTRREMRLPTEAEWEYACRAGTTSPYSFGDDAAKLAVHDWYDKNSGAKPHPVGKKRPNPWGLYDIHGNVWEWVSDWYSADYYALGPMANPTGPKEGNARLLRGGGWTDNAHWCRSAIRYTQTPGIRRDYLGFRALVVPDHSRDR